MIKQLTVFTKPVTATAILMLQDEGKLNVADPVTKYLPEFAALKTPSGQPANLTITQILTHTSGLGKAAGPAAQQAKTLADLVPLWLAAPMKYEPGAIWQYTQSGINAAARIVEVVSDQTFPAFLQTRLFGLLGLKHTTHYPTTPQLPPVATPYAKNKTTGQLDAVTAIPPAPGTRPPSGNAGLYPYAHDYARFCQMLLNGDTLDGRCYLSPAAMKFLNTPQTGDLHTGFFQNDTYVQRGANYGWGIATCILKTPHEGVPAMLSPGTYRARRRLGHTGVDRSRPRCRLLTDGSAYQLPQQRCERRPEKFPTSLLLRPPPPVATVVIRSPRAPHPATHGPRRPVTKKYRLCGLW
jgi:CubicO group peptidase (beta-lactamase class C family)